MTHHRTCALLFRFYPRNTCYCPNAIFSYTEELLHFRLAYRQALVVNASPQSPCELHVVSNALIVCYGTDHDNAVACSTNNLTRPAAPVA
jgi:hypothetical protein